MSACLSRLQAAEVNLDVLGGMSASHACNGFKKSGSRPECSGQVEHSARSSAQLKSVGRDLHQFRPSNDSKTRS